MKGWAPPIAMAVVLILFLFFGPTFLCKTEKIYIPVPGPVETVTAVPQPAPTVTVTAPGTPVPGPTVTVTATPTTTHDSDLKLATEVIVGFVQARSQGDYYGMKPYMTSMMASHWAEGDMHYFAHGYQYVPVKLVGNYATFELVYDVYKIEWSSGEVQYKNQKLENTLYMVKTSSGWKIAEPSNIACFVFIR